MKKIQMLSYMLKGREITPKRLYNAAKCYAAMKMGRTKVSGYPSIMMVEPTNLCQLSCPLCPTGNGTLKVPRGSMKIAEFKRIIDECGPYLLNLTLWNWGEPFLNNDVYDMIEYAKSKRIFVRVSTNGHLLKDAKNIERVVRSGMDELIFSLDGASKETFMKYRKSGDFDVVMDNLKKLVETKKRLRSRTPFVEIQFIVMRHNEHEVPKIRQLAKDIGVDALKLKTVNLEMEVKGQREKNKKYLPRDENYSRYTKNLEKKDATPLGCTRLWLSSVVNWDGSVSPCCYDPNRMLDLGNVFKSGSFRSVWNSEKYKAMRKAVIENKSAIIMCRECSGKLMGLDVE